jgi:ABC-2 type transport system permease protein
MVLLTAGVAAMYPGLFAGTEEIMAMGEMLRSPAMVGMMGPVYGLESLNTSILFSETMSCWMMIAIAVMNIFFINRHTRVDEELGRLEMLRALPIGRLAGAKSAIMGAFVLNFVIALLTAISIIAVNMDGTTTAGAFAYALSISVVGFLFASVTLFMAQLFSTSRGSAGGAFLMLGIFYALRAFGDVSENVLSYISPMGLGLRTFAFFENNFQYIGIIFAEGLIISWLAYLICAKRDLGQGVFSARKGSANASRFLKSPFGLAWRLTRNGVLVWCLVIFVCGASYGSFLGDIESFVSKNEMYKQLVEAGYGVAASITENFIALLYCIIALLATVPIINLANKIHSEEKHGRLEPVLARSVGRVKMFGCYIIIATVESAAVLFCGAVGLYMASANTGLVSFGTLLKAAMVYLPALWVMMGISVFLIGILPKLTVLNWAIYAYSFGAVYFGRLFDMPEWSLKITPFGNIPQLPVQELNMTPLIVLTLIAVALTTVGMIAFSRRDIE